LTVRSLLAAVRRRLWRDRFIDATRHALWAWAALLTAATALHLALGQPGLAMALAVACVAWLVALAWAALRRPTLDESGVFADRFLGGESAYSTWLEAGVAVAGVRQTPALLRLAQWTDTAAPTSRAALAALHTPSRLAGPLAAAGICTAVAALVMALPDVARNPTAQTEREARDGAKPAEALSIDDDALARELEAELATSADSSVGPNDPARGSMRRDDRTDPTAQAAESSLAAPLSTRDEVMQSTVEASGMAARDGGAPAGTPQGQPADDGVGRASVARTPGSGREAGTTRDDLSATEGSPILPGALAVQRRDIIRPGDEAARQADMAQAGIYAGETARASGVPAAAPTVAAARPPAARRETALSPAEAAYVAAWGEAMNAARAARQ
jgi:hypothetical protein